MMVSISGERGVGKTLYLAGEVYKRSMQGYFCITNFSHSHSNLDCSGMSPEEFMDVLLNVIDFKDMGYEMYHLHPSFRHTGVYVAMDEATIYFSPEMQAKLSKKDPQKYTRLLNLLAQARKYDMEIEYVVQDPAKVGKDFRRYTETYVRLRWLLKIKRLAYIPHPRLPIYRREHRHVIDVIWKETHNLDAENPKFNYTTVRDDNGIYQFTDANTILSKKLALTGRYKKHIFRMYNSYQPVAVKQKEYSKEYSPLKAFHLIDGVFKKEKLPTIKKLLRIKPTDAQLPTKVGFGDIIVPLPDERNKIISEVQSQQTEVKTIDDLAVSIEMFLTKNKKKLAKKFNMLDTENQEDATVLPQEAETLEITEVPQPSLIKKYFTFNDPKKLARAKRLPMIIPTPENA